MTTAPPLPAARTVPRVWGRVVGGAALLKGQAGRAAQRLQQVLPPPGPGTRNPPPGTNDIAPLSKSDFIGLSPPPPRPPSRFLCRRGGCEGAARPAGFSSPPLQEKRNRNGVSGVRLGKENHPKPTQIIPLCQGNATKNEKKKTKLATSLYLSPPTYRPVHQPRPHMCHLELHKLYSRANYATT